MHETKRKRRLVQFIAIVGLILTFFNKGLIAQQDEQDSLGENYLNDVKEFYESVLEIDSSNYDALTNLGVIYQQIGDLEKSLSFFKKIVKFYPQKARAFHNLGILYSLMNRIDDAVISLNKAAELDSTSPNSIRQLGIIYLQNEKFSEAIESFNLALIRNYLDTESRIGKAIAYWSLKDYDKVITEINEMQSLGLRFNRMELLLADVYFKMNDYENATKYAKLDKAENSSQAEGHYLLGVLYKMDGEKEKAEFEFNEAFEITKQNKNDSLEFDINTFLKLKEGHKNKRWLSE